MSTILGSYLLLAGIVLFSATTLFHLVTLPCEFNASRRALAELELSGWYSGDELGMSKEVLRAAAMTYVAALAMSLIQLLRLLKIFANRRD
jgi:Zn-dependent membrane protease YugP